MDSTMIRVSGTDTIYSFRIDSLVLQPKQYAVIDARTKFFSQFPLLKEKKGMIVLHKADLKLKDSGNMGMLINSDRSIIDSLALYANWHSPNVTDHTGISL